jgi:DNA polymerase-4
MIMHIDMDAFFASVEQRYNPSLKGKAVVVGGNPEKRRGVVSTCSYEARKYGIKSGMSLFQAKKLCPDATYLQCDGSKYEFISAKLQEIFSEFTPLVEPYSIDEVFLDVTGCERLWGTPVEIGLRIKQKIKRNLDLTCSVGIASNKILAEVASGMQKPDGLTFVPKEKMEGLIYPLPIQELCGVGPNTLKVMHKFGIRTIGQLASYSKEVIKSALGKYGENLYYSVQGENDSIVLPVQLQPEEKSIGHEQTLVEDIGDGEKLSAFLLFLSSRVARRVRRGNFLAKTVTVKVRFSDFFTLSKSESLKEPTNSEEEIYKMGKKLLGHLFSGMQKVRLLGISVSNLIKTSFPQQLSLPFSIHSEKKKNLLFAVDKLKDEFGERVVTWGTCLLTPE